MICYCLGGENKMNLKSKAIKVLYSFVIVMAGVAVNSTCFCRFHQEKLDSQLDSLKKYHDK